ncbi:TerB family tellurite resistance protein [Albibacterium sp.]|uniref:TerB family tellurite resistance protein n=1 Tax=Albibacterium sp. TaxID=2952885 RepID=UPI002B86D65E|nr:TerB family tellurite resistance protein [Albibacterium sp.]HUH19367.1 hypothetical protein [Albibacterium sp.]
MKCIWLSILIIGTNLSVKAQSKEIQQLMLNYEKLTQLKNILTDMKKGYQVVSNGYTAIKDISEGNFNLHDAFIEGLLSVSPAIKNYKRVPDIIQYQKYIIREYKNAYKNFKLSGFFNEGEIEYMGNVYSNLFNQSVKSLDELATVITSSKLSMSDDERLHAIDRIFAETEDKLQFLRMFNKNAKILALQRSKEFRNLESSQKLYQLNLN